MVCQYISKIDYEHVGLGGEGMAVLRSLLFVPGNQPRMLERASKLKPDAFIPDMEDSVPIDEKRMRARLRRHILLNSGQVALQ